MMTNLIARRRSAVLWAIVPAGAALAAVVAHGPLGLDASPFRIIAVILGAALVLLVVAHHPAAFVAPVLFMPREMDIAQLRGMGPAEDLTMLQVTAGLVGAGVLFRSLFENPIPTRSIVLDQVESPQEYIASDAVRTRYTRRARIGFLFFSGVVTVSYFYTLAPDYGGDKLFEFLVLCGGLFFAAPLIFQGESDFRDFTVGTVLFGLIVALSSLTFSATGAMGAGDNPAHIGKGQAIGLAMLLLLYSPITHKLLRTVVLWVCIPWLALGLVAAETRGPLFSLVVVLLFSLLLRSFRSPLVSRRHMAFAAAALVVSVMLLSAYWFYGNENARFNSKSDEVVALLEGSGEARGTAVMRLNYYRDAIGIWLARPLFGYGVGGWSVTYWLQDIRQYPHNLILEVLTEEGLVGFAALVFFLAMVFRQLRECLSETVTLAPALLPCLIYLLGLVMFSGAIDDNRFLWFWCGLTLTGCEMAVRARKKGQQIDNAFGSQNVSGPLITAPPPVLGN